MGFIKNKKTETRFPIVQHYLVRFQKSRFILVSLLVPRYLLCTFFADYYIGKIQYVFWGDSLILHEGKHYYLPFIQTLILKSSVAIGVMLAALIYFYKIVIRILIFTFSMDTPTPSSTIAYANKVSSVYHQPCEICYNEPISHWKILPCTHKMCYDWVYLPILWIILPICCVVI